ncbi:hypothetical protein [Mycobacteroides chelonae]|uniref:Uncharacterized protein n=1 Tax=Mycobacteroides chelonae TaxID=1774 RepID=A0A1S1LYR7_MYCCH|nr:hypothetical protein [Mycobacteroides chelonae]OHU76070.1 hypothetical protein BKG84_24560 [Mycobacteroides chelonae]
MSKTVKLMGELPPVVQLAHLRQMQSALRTVPRERHEDVAKGLVRQLEADYARVVASRGPLPAAPKDPILEQLPRDGSSFEFFSLYIDGHVAELQRQCRAPRFVQNLVGRVIEMTDRRFNPTTTIGSR